MNEIKDHLVNFNIVGPLSLALLIPLIACRVINALILRKRYNGLIGKVVVVTGASSGLGEALAHEFYKHGAQVVLCSRRRQELERVRTDLLHTYCKDITHPPIIIPLDLSDTAELPNHIDKILSITGKIDILVNNGGITHRGLVQDTLLDVYKNILAVNFFGTVALTKAVLIDMMRKKMGQIIFISSIQGLIALPNRSGYAASKHALQAFADSLRAEVAAHNISVTVISPGYIKTNLSMNALTGTGQVHGVMDETTNSGYSPEYAAEKIVKAVVLKRKELVLSPILPKIALFLRIYLPSVYFFVMERRAKTTGLKELLETNAKENNKNK